MEAMVVAQDAGKVGGFETPSPDPGNYGTLSSDERKALLKRTFQLAIALAILVASLWFCRRMLTGRWVVAIRPVHHRVSDE
jgi:hypothetical protein